MEEAKGERERGRSKDRSGRGAKEREERAERRLSEEQRREPVSTFFEPNSPRRVFQQLDGSAPANQIDRTLRQSPDSRTDGPYL